jgi:hypothetical protein
MQPSISLLSGAHGMGSACLRPVELERHTDAGSRCLFLWNRRRPFPRTLGASEGVRVYSAGRFLRHDPLLDHLARRPHQLPPSTHTRRSERGPGALAAWEVGICNWARRGARIRSQNLVGLPCQPDRGIDFPECPNNSLLCPSPTRVTCHKRLNHPALDEGFERTTKGPIRIADNCGRRDHEMRVQVSDSFRKYRRFRVLS